MQNERIEPFEKGTHIMWNDPHISKQLLKFHLDPDNDAASRRPESIDRVIDWIEDGLIRKGSKILDLGCGPGLYCQRLAMKGYSVTGLDISKTSIEYARSYAEENDLAIDYIHGDYIFDKIPGDNDMVMIIYCDLGVLDDKDRDKLLKKIHRSLKIGGRILFDVAGPRSFHDVQEGTKIERHHGGFWSTQSYSLEEKVKKYPEINTILHEHMVKLNNGENRTYRFWDRCYSKDEIKRFLERTGFYDVIIRDDIIKDSNFRTSKIIFATAIKE